MEYGYVRVSTKEQNVDRQLLSMQNLGLNLDNIVIEKQSGKDFDRPLYKGLISRLKEGDVLFIKSLDRLGRDYEKLQEEWRYITKDIKADIVIIDMPILDTRLYKDLLGTFISDVFLSVLSFFAENERSYIKQRQAEGIEAAHKRGVKFGRPSLILPANFNEVGIKWLNKEISLNEASRILNMAPSSFRRYCHRLLDLTIK